MAILAVLASVIVPMAEVTAKRGKELELRRSLREIRTAIDNYKADFDKAVEEKKIIAAINETGYPKSLINANTSGGCRRTPSMSMMKVGDCARTKMILTQRSTVVTTSMTFIHRACDWPWMVLLTIPGEVYDFEV